MPLIIFLSILVIIITFVITIAMPDTNAPAPARPTLTQRRDMGPIKAIPRMESSPSAPEPSVTSPSLDRPMRMSPIGGRPAVGGIPGGPRPGAPVTTEKGSPLKIVMWVVLVIGIAVASYFAIKNNFSEPVVEPTPTPTVTPTVVETVSFFGDKVMLDSEAKDVADEASFSNDAQVLGKETEASFSINSIVGTKYDTFTRFAFEMDMISGAETVESPYVMAEYNPDSDNISLVFKNTLLKSGILELDEESAVGTYTVNNFYRTSAEVETDEQFVITLDQASTYVLHLADAAEGMTILLDVKEVVKPVETATPSVTVAPSGIVTVTPSGTVTATPKPTQIVGGNILENDFSKLAQTLTNGLTTNTADMVCKEKCLYWIETASTFTFDKPVELGDNGKYPSVSASLEGSKLKVVVSNLSTKSATSNMSFAGSKLVRDLDAVRSGNTLTYEFNLTSVNNYRILFTKSDYINNADVLRIQVKP